MAQQLPLIHSGGELQVIPSGDTLDPAYLGTGTRDGSRFLRDDGVYAVPAGGGGVPTVIHARAASTGNVSVSSAPASIDGVTLNTGDIVLLKNQTTPSQNGLYDFNGTGNALIRTSSMANASTVRAGLLITVSEGTLNLDSLWMLTSNGNSQTVGTDALEFKTQGTDKVIGITVDGGGSVITTGVKGYIVAGFSGTIVGWDLVADVSGSVVLDVWKSAANTIPTVANTIAGTEKPTLSSAQINNDLTLTTWTSSISKGEVIGFNVDSAATVTRITLTIRVA